MILSFQNQTHQGNAHLVLSRGQQPKSRSYRGLGPDRGLDPDEDPNGPPREDPNMGDA